MHYLLFYSTVEDYAQRRGRFRAAHLEHARRAVERGELVLGGALADPVDRAVLLFRGSSPAAAEAFAAEDPYVQNGLVKSWQVREWTTVVGRDAEVKIPGEASWAERAKPPGVRPLMQASGVRRGHTKLQQAARAPRALILGHPGR